MTIGNAGGVELKLNGKSLGVPGEVGKVARVKIPKDAILEAAPVKESTAVDGDRQDDGFDE